MKGWLSGWKNIAKYMGVSVSTAKRYNEILKMPILDGQGNSKFAIPQMMDAWIIRFNEKRKTLRKK